MSGAESDETIRYAQVWEDADVLHAALDVRPGDRCVSIASAGDNALALLTGDPERVVAVDRSAAQLACVGLRIAAYRTLDHAELLELLGSRASDRRRTLYERCRQHGGLDGEHAAFWDARPDAIERGIAGAGRFESYFRIFRRRVLPLVHRPATVRALVEPRERRERERFYEERWNSLRWRLVFRVFFSRFVMARLGRDPAFFRYVEGSVGRRILDRARHALVELDPADNPYVHWILFGSHGAALPHALRSEHFETIRARVDRVELRRGDLAEVARSLAPGSIDRWNLSDVFEYLSPAAAAATAGACCDASRVGARLAWWNMLVPRTPAEMLPGRLAALDELASALHARDRAFFYARFVAAERVA